MYLTYPSKNAHWFSVLLSVLQSPDSTPCPLGDQASVCRQQHGVVREELPFPGPRGGIYGCPVGVSAYVKTTSRSVNTETKYTKDVFVRNTHSSFKFSSFFNLLKGFGARDCVLYQSLPTVSHTLLLGMGGGGGGGGGGVSLSFSSKHDFVFLIYNFLKCTFAVPFILGFF